MLRSERVVMMKGHNRNDPYEFVDGVKDYRFSLIYEPLYQFLPRLLQLHSLTMMDVEDQK